MFLLNISQIWGLNFYPKYKIVWEFYSDALSENCSQWFSPVLSNARQKFKMMCYENKMTGLIKKSLYCGNMNTSIL